MPPKNKYTDPELREEVKEEIKESDKGGAPGQWSARKAQMMASEYKKRGGDYTTDKETGQDESQKNLSKWGEENWQTKDGSGEARNEDGSRQRYLPKKAWEKMDEAQKDETDQKKQRASRKGQQFVGNTDEARESRKEANEKESEEFEARKEEEKAEKQKQKQTQSKGKVGRPAKKDAGSKNKQTVDKKQEEENDNENGDKLEEDDAAAEDGEEDVAKEQKAGSSEEDDSGYNSADKKPGDKRGRSKKGDGQAENKKSKGDSGKTMGSKHDSTDEPAQKGSADRLPKQGQRVSWKAMPGWVHGVLEKIVTNSGKVDGKQVRASKSDPRFVLKADSGKICVHKPETCFYD